MDEKMKCDICGNEKRKREYYLMGRYYIIDCDT